jgi:hypothetical protein
MTGHTCRRCAAARAVDATGRRWLGATDQHPHVPEHAPCDDCVAWFQTQQDHR